MPSENEVEVPSVTVPESYPQSQPEEWFDDVHEEPRIPTPEGSHPKQPPASPPPAPKPKNSHPRWVERAAIKMGLSDQEIEEMPTELLTQKVFEASERKTQEAAAGAMKHDRGQEKPRVVEQDTKPVQDPYAGLELDLNAGWDEGFVKTWTSLVERLKAQDAKIARLEGTANQFQAAQAQTVQQQIEGFFSKYPEVYMPGGERDDFRCETIMNSLNSFLRQGKATTLANDLERAHKGLFGSFSSQPVESPKPSVDPTREAIKEAYTNGGVTRPTQRNAAPLPKGRAAAIAAGDKYLQEHSVSGVQHDDDPTDTLP